MSLTRNVILMIRVAAAEPSARLGHRRPFNPGHTRRDRQAAVVGNRLVPQTSRHSPPADAASKSTRHRRRHVLRDCLAERPIRRRLALRLRLLSVDLTPYLKSGGDNVIAIRLDNPPDSSRWYPGGGIYRNVWLTKTNPVHVAQWGTYVTTPRSERGFGHDRSQVRWSNNSRPSEVNVTTASSRDRNGRRRGERSRRSWMAQ